MSGGTVLGSITLPAIPESVREARQFAADLLPPGDQAETTILLISEATTNSLTHSVSRHGGKFTVTLYDLGDGEVRAEVIDDGGLTVPVRGDPGTLSTCGRGVALIEDLAARSGWDIDAEGRLHTWFELPR